MSTLTPLQRRQSRKGRNQSSVDLNLVALIDVFTILIFFLLANVGGAELLATPKAVNLPEAHSEKAPRETLVMVVNTSDIVLEGRRVVTVAEALATADDLIPALKAELDAHAGRLAVKPENQGLPKAITIMGDKEIPYRLLKKVMFTAARADFADVSFAVRRKGEL